MAITPTTTYENLRASIQKDKDERIREHQGKIAARGRMFAAVGAGAAQALNMIAQGDSWFDYPFPFLKFDQSDVIAHLRRVPVMPPEILNLAHHGEAAEDMLGVKKLHELIDGLKNHAANGKFDAILFSGGGNDLAGDQFRLWLTNAASSGGVPTKGLNQERVNSIMGVVSAAYQDLFAARDDVAKGTPIFSHSYDFPIPDGRHVPCAGPWLKPGFDDRGWGDMNAARAIVKQLLTEFDSMLDVFAANQNYNFVHVKTQGTLADDLWANELHPTPQGFSLITAKFVDALRLRFPGRI